MTWITLVCTIINLAILLVLFITFKNTSFKCKHDDTLSMIDEEEIKRKTVGPTPETINLIKSCQAHEENCKTPMVSETVTQTFNSIPSTLRIPHEHVNIATMQEETVTHQVIEQTKQVAQQQIQQVAVQTTKAPIVKARTIQEQRQIITNFLKLKEDTLKPDKVLVKELGTTIGTLEKYATTEQMTEWARLRQLCFSKPRFTTSSINNTPTSLEQNNNKRVMEA